MTIIRPFRLEDAADLAAALNNPAILNNLRDGLPYPYTKRDATDFIRSTLSADPDKNFSFAIVVADRVVGSIGAFRQENIHSRTAEMGYYIAQDQWGKGLTTRAVRELCALLFAQTDLLRIFAEPFSHNAASCRVLEKAGFLREGILRQNAVKNAQIVDMILYAKLKA